MILIETLLQGTAFHSQMKEHEKALEKATKCFQTFKLFFKALSKVMDNIILIGPENLKTFRFSSIEEFLNLYKYVEYINNKVKLPNSNDQ